MILGHLGKPGHTCTKRFHNTSTICGAPAIEYLATNEGEVVAYLCADHAVFGVEDEYKRALKERGLTEEGRK